mgnify:FL=1
MNGITRFVILNGLPLNAFPFPSFSLRVVKTNLEEIKRIRDMYEVDNEEYRFANYVRHSGTLKLLSEKLDINFEANAGLYQYEPNDIIYVITLNTPQRGQEKTEISENDISVYKIIVTA